MWPANKLIDFNLRLPANAQLFFLAATLTTSIIIVPVNAAATSAVVIRENADANVGNLYTN
jgi:hypothetical protein